MCAVECTHKPYYCDILHTSSTTVAYYSTNYTTVTYYTHKIYYSGILHTNYTTIDIVCV
jgi:hypothetical protein